MKRNSGISWHFQNHSVVCYISYINLKALAAMADVGMEDMSALVFDLQ